MKDKLYLIQIDGLSVEEDEYQEGCNGNIFDDTWHGDSHFYVTSLEHLKEKLIEITGISITPDMVDVQHLDNDLENLYHFSYSMNKNYMTPSEEEIESWKRGEIVLYLADLYFTIFEITPVKEISGMKKN